MKGNPTAARRLGILAVLLAAAFLLPLRTYSGGEIDLRQCISKLDGIAVGETVTFGTCALPVPGVVVRWDFGDGSPQEEGWPVVHAYQAPGLYTVSAVATYRTGGAPIPTIPTQLRVVAAGTNRPPHAEATAAPAQALAGMPVTFDAGASRDDDGRIVRYFWDFRDGTKTITTSAVIQHTFARAGTYHVLLTVTDNGEADASTVVPVEVSALPSKVVSGPERAIPPVPEGASRPLLPALIVVDMGVYDTGRFPPRYEYVLSLAPPFRLVATSNRDWLAPVPADYELLSGNPIQVTEYISVSNTSVLPRAHTSWGQVTVSVNGWIMELPVAITVRGERDISAEVWPLYQDIVDYLTAQGQRSALVSSPRFANGADAALGFITEYLLENGYDGKMPRQEFIVKVAELLMDRDVNGDQVVGFTDPDIGMGVKRWF